MKLFIALSLLTGQTLAILNLTQISFTKLSGCQADNGNTVDAMFQYGAVKAAFEETYRMLYIIGRPPSGSTQKNGCLRIFSGLDSGQPTEQLSMQLDNPLDGELLSIAACSNAIALSFSGSNPVSEGHVRMYHPFQFGQSTLEPISNEHTFVGPYPKHMAFTSDCSKIVVANEGIPGVINGQLVDPNGAVSIITRNDGGNPSVSEVLFDVVNGDNTAAYQQRGVRYVYRGDSGFTNTLSQDLEPEFVAINVDDSKAYVILQENNALAVIDLLNNNLLDIYAFPEKNWANYQLDASDTDKQYQFGHYDVRSFAQPKVMLVTSLFSIPGDAIITANTGARKSFDFGSAGSFSEGTRLRTLMNDQALSPGISQALVDAINDNSRLGRLYASENDGKNINNNLIETIYFYGSRDMAMLSANSSGLFDLFSSGDELETSAAAQYNDVFNGDTTSTNSEPTSEMDSRSDDMGPEPMAMAGGSFGSSDIPFLISGSRNGIIYIFTLRTGFPALESLYRAGNQQGTWNTLYNNDQIGDNIISDMGTIEKGILSANPFIYVISEASGSFSIYEVREN
ncbi:mesenchyme-specific cell surface glycoprotein-like [Pecten maximus]|uniref:mesenchyme-specific cell surface glycoprotein-like n=1 Tax=Pecten maximus TaxID=6579 RepID=UPI001458FA55|nr:mesenchyme-specific cell surface glycoprotein-like [Pecten maximus]